MSTDLQRWWRPRRRHRIIVFVTLALMVGLGACSGSDDDDQGSAASEAVVVHVHGLGVNPADSELYVATHNGLFRLPDSGPAVRMGDGHQDTMGFTVAGPDRFLASGHPGLDDTELRAEGKPPLLGLVESTDAGETWSPRSLLGEADFHGLAFAHGRVYGWNASTGEFLVSDDMRSWQTRSRTDLFSFAVDPEDADHIVATGPQGLMTSDDAGATWVRSSGPPLVLVSWSPGGVLWGMTADGTVHRGDDGAELEEAGHAPGQPQALHATDEVLYAAVHDADGRTAIHVSEDGATTWQLRYQDPDQ